MDFDQIPFRAALEPVGLVSVLALSALFFILTSSRKSDLPFVNPKRPFEFSITEAKKRYLKDAHNIIMGGLKKAGAFRVITENGVRTILSPKYADDIRSHRSLSLTGALHTEHHVNIPGFEAVKVTVSSELIQDTVRTKLTQNLAKLTEPLCDEMEYVLQNQWTDNKDWHEVALRPKALGIIASLSSRVFLGTKICRNPDWLHITVNYAVDSLMAAAELRLWPEILRPLAARFNSKCRKIRQELQEARDIITPVLDERADAKATAIKKGETPERYYDAIQWLEENSKGRNIDPAAAQLALSTAAIHTTTDLLTQTILDVAVRPGLIDEMRKEIVSVIGEKGWTKSTLYDLKLMDSVVKECQRVKPMAIAKMARLAEDNVVLSDGTVIPKGEIILVSCSRMWDSSVYEDPESFDPYRFLKMRQGASDSEAQAQLVSPSPEHMGFGFGRHVCPGRFFAANELKIALTHILMKYDLKLAEGYTPKILKSGMRLSADPMARVAIKRRREEVSLDQF